MDCRQQCDGEFFGSVVSGYGHNAFCGAHFGSGVWRSEDRGNSWIVVNTGLTASVYGSLAFIGKTIFVGTSQGVFRSEDKGNTWVTVGLTKSEVSSLAVIGTTLFAGTPKISIGGILRSKGGVYRSEDNGNTWTLVNTGLIAPYVNSLAVMGKTLFAGTPGGVFRSENRGDTWTTTNTGLMSSSVRSLAVMDKTLFTGTPGGAFRSEDLGKSWVTIDTGLTDTDIRAFAVMGKTLFAATISDGIFRSEDKGNTWVKAGLENQFVTSLSVMGTTLFAGTYYKGVFRSDDQGRSWIEVNNGIPPWKWDIEVNALAVMGDTIFASINWMGVYRSEDRGNSWVRVSGAYKSLSVFGKTLYATSDLGGVFRSEDGGNSWTALGLGDKGIRALTVMGTTLYAASPAISFGRGMYCFDAESQKWREVNKGLTNKTVYSLAVIDRTLFAGTGGGVFRASLSETAVAVEQKGKLPTSWGKIKTALLQNYPNPFNPETWIPFSLAEDSKVTIQIYDIQGNLIRTLNLGMKEKGLYLSKDKAAHWDGRNERGELVASGVYFVELNAKKYQQVRRMVLVK